MPLIYYVEDDENIRNLVLYSLTSAGYEAQGFDCGEDFWRAFSERTPDLVLLDIMLPGQDGVEWLRRLREREQKIPVMMLTARSSEYDKVLGLDAGADDYLTKPFGVMELVSRVKAVLRRCRPVQQQVLRCSGLAVDTKEHTVTADGVRVELTYKEFQLLRLFLSHVGTAFTRDQLMEQVWGMDFCGESRTIDMHIRTLRQKLGAYGEHIETVRSVGYRWRAQL